jgi:CheY-like chemotaxis protein
MTPMSIYDGKRVLIVEDEAMIAMMLEDLLLERGAVIAGSAATIANGTALAESEELDCAILDVNVRGEFIAPVAAILKRRRIPVIFATGYGSDAVVAIAGESPTIDKRAYTQNAGSQPIAQINQAFRSNPLSA